jgi:Asp-tRNA(Asn)/Glu-tRNA(Gln) amidotransferase A subunit family amidase
VAQRSVAGVSLLEGSPLLAFGSDTAGSVRIPACMTGNAGLKVTMAAGPPKVSCRYPLRSTHRGFWRAASPTSPTASARSILPPSTRPR